MFIGRRKEPSLLEDAYSSNQSAFIPVYGCRRVGKSELILKFIDHKPGIYHLGKMAPAALQIREFLQEAARVLDEPLLSSYRRTTGRMFSQQSPTNANQKKTLLSSLTNFNGWQEPVRNCRLFSRNFGIVHGENPAIWCLLYAARMLVLWSAKYLAEKALCLGGARHRFFYDLFRILSQHNFIPDGRF